VDVGSRTVLVSDPQLRSACRAGGRQAHRVGAGIDCLLHPTDLSRLVRAGEIEPTTAREALDEASALPQRLVLPTAAHLRRAYALRERIRVLDGLYVALADELGCTLVTTDRRLAAATAPCDVRTP